MLHPAMQSYIVVAETNYVAHMWKNVRLSQPVEFSPDGHGWKLGTENMLEIVWFEVEQKHLNIKIDVTGAEDESDNDDVQASSSDEEYDNEF